MDKPLDRRRTAMELIENMFNVEMRFLQSGSESLDVLACAFHAEIVVHEPRSLPYAGDWNGLDGVGALFRKMREIWSDVAVEDLQVAQNDDTVHELLAFAFIAGQWRNHQTAVCRSVALQG